MPIILDTKYFARNWKLEKSVRYLPQPAKIRILFLVEGLNFTRSDGFSFERVIDFLREDSAVSYANFELTLAEWGNSPNSALAKNNNPSNYQATYTGYRFSHVDPGSGNNILDEYDELWLFGISPNTNDPVSVTQILGANGQTPHDMAPSDAELKLVKRWMDAGGGVFATGDHASLGAYLAARIPRVWTMRRWTEEDGAPTRIGEDRVDTNRPMRPSQQPGANEPETIPFEAQSDDVPQSIAVKHYPTNTLQNWPYFQRSWRPHPVLCGGELGVVNVFPDHPHEGWINELSEIQTAAQVQFTVSPGDSSAEYPTVAGVQPLPEVIAWGNTLPSSNQGDYTPGTVVQEKGYSPAKRFGVLGAYDGHRAQLGRVLVDSTWHHWMSVNLSGTYAPSTDEDPATPGIQPLVGLMEAGGDNLAKIVTYYRNTAVWLAPPAKQRTMLGYLAFWVVLGPRSFEDWRRDTPLFELGKEGRDVLGQATSDCVVSSLISILVPERELEVVLPVPIPIPELPPPCGEKPLPDPWGPWCLSCPPDDWRESVAIGVLLHRMMQLRDELVAAPERLEKMEGLKLDRMVEDVLDRSSADATKIMYRYAEHRAERLEHSMNLLRTQLERVPAKKASD